MPSTPHDDHRPPTTATRITLTSVSESIEPTWLACSVSASGVLQRPGERAIDVADGPSSSSAMYNRPIVDQATMHRSALGEHDQPLLSGQARPSRRDGRSWPSRRSRSLHLCVTRRSGSIAATARTRTPYRWSSPRSLMTPARRSPGASGSTETLNFLARGWSPPSISHGIVRSRRILTVEALVMSTQWRRVDAAEQRTRPEAQPVGAAAGREDADIELSIVEPGIGKDVDATEDPPDVADQHAHRSSLEPRLAVDVDRHVGARGAEVACCGLDVGDPSETLLGTVIGIADHQGVEPRASHHGERLTVDDADIDPPRDAVQGDVESGVEVDQGSTRPWRGGWRFRPAGWPPRHRHPP